MASVSPSLSAMSPIKMFQLFREALMSVAVSFFENVDLGNDAMKVQ